MDADQTDREIVPQPPAQADETPLPAPVARGERIASLDFIRGIAVLGILFSNIVDFSHPDLAYFWPFALPQPLWPSDHAMWVVQYLLIDGKMRGLFSLLFGAGMVLFLDRASARGDSGVLQVRRLMLLGLFGLAHYLFLFTGDILMTYAMAGLMVMWTVDWSPRKLLTIGVIGFFVGGLIFASALGQGAVLEHFPAQRLQFPGAWPELQADWDTMLANAQVAREVYGGSSYAGVLAHNLAELPGGLSNGLFFAIFETAPLMLIGMGLYKVGVFSGASGFGNLRRRAWIMLLAGGAATLPLALWALASDFPPRLTLFIFQGIGVLPRLPMIIGLAILLALATPRLANGRLGRRIVACGRMAFSNYIGTSLVMILVFQGWAGGLHGQLHRLELLGVVVLGWVAMLFWSQPWLARFRYGPLEWLWRCLTYRKRFAIWR